MVNQLVAKEGDFEARAKQLIVNFRTYDEGPIRYEFDNVITIKVEEERLGRKQIKDLQYRNFFLFRSDGIYHPNSSFTENVGSLFNNFLHDGGPYKGTLCRAIEDYMKGRPFPKHMRLERGSECNTLSIDLTLL